MAAGSPAVDAPAPSAADVTTRVPALLSVAPRLPVAKHGGSLHRLLSALDLAALQQYTLEEPRSLTARRPGGASEQTPPSQESRLPAAALAAASARGLQQTDRVRPSELEPRPAAPALALGALDETPMQAACRKGSGLPFEPASALGRAGLAELGSAVGWHQFQDLTLASHIVDPTSLMLTGQTFLPAWEHHFTAGLATAHLVPVPVRILARQNKV